MHRETLVCEVTLHPFGLVFKLLLEDDVDVDPLEVVEYVDVRDDEFGVLRGSSFASWELCVAGGIFLYGGMFLESSRAT